MTAIIKPTGWPAARTTAADGHELHARSLCNWRSTWAIPHVCLAAMSHVMAGSRLDVDVVIGWVQP
jgi:hypothetical protein